MHGPTDVRYLVIERLSIQDRLSLTNRALIVRLVTGLHQCAVKPLWTGMAHILCAIGKSIRSDIGEHIRDPLRRRLAAFLKGSTQKGVEFCSFFWRTRTNQASERAIGKAGFISPCTIDSFRQHSAIILSKHRHPPFVAWWGPSGAVAPRPRIPARS